MFLIFFLRHLKKLEFTGFFEVSHFLICSKNDLLHQIYTISTPFCAKTMSHAGTKSGCLLGACSHKGNSGFGPIRRQPRLSELVREVHGGASRELAHIKAAPVLDLYGESRDRMNVVHKLHGEQFCNHS